MKYIKIKNFIFFMTFNICFFFITNSIELTTENIIAPIEESADINFKYDNESLDTILNHFAALKKVNIIFPSGENLNTKVTLHIAKKLTLQQAWDLINTLLDIAGFCMVPQGNIVRIVKNNKEIFREPMPTYIGVSPDELPDSDQQIRYLYYFANIRVSDAPENEINGILKDLLPESALFKADNVTNGLLIVAKANDIRAAMHIITELDQINFQETVDILSLFHTSADIVAKLINEQLVKPENANPYRLDTKKPKEVPYFSGFTKIIPIERLNKLIILGRPQAIDRLKSFIKQYIDVEPDSGKSILHIYRLQYLDAQKLAPVLAQIVQSGSSGGPSQVSGTDSATGGIERFFDRVIIHTDSPTNLGGDQANASGRQQYTYYGGNNLVIAARNDDWKQIKKLIEELDIPQEQVLIEVLIADLTVEDTRMLGSMTRVPNKVPFPDTMDFQSSTFGQPIPTELPAIPTTSLDSNLLSNAYTAGTTPPTLSNPTPTPDNTNLANFAQSGTTMLSLNDNDGDTWSIWELLQLFTSSKILSHPHVMARNNNEAIVSIGQTRWLVDKVKDVASNYYGGATTIQYKPIEANLTVKITPRISSANTVNLQVLVDINEYQSPSASDNTINIRKLETNANIKSGGIFALGGLIRTTNTNSTTEVPFLGKIPILGWFFKRKSNDMIKNNLTVFICPTVIKPRLRSGISDFTQDYVNLTKSASEGALFDSLKDPITHWFFKKDIDTANVMDKFIAKDEALPIDKKEKRKKKKNKTTSNEKLAVAENDTLKEMLRNEPNPFLKA